MVASVGGGKHIVVHMAGYESAGGFYNRQKHWNVTATITNSGDAFMNAFQQEILAGGCKMCTLEN